MLEKIVDKYRRITTVNSDEVTRVVFSEPYKNYFIRNDGENVAFANADVNNLDPRTDGTVTINKNQVCCVFGSMISSDKDIYVTGNVTIIATNDNINPFKVGQMEQKNPVLSEINIVENGNYLASNFDCDGFSTVNVDVKTPNEFTFNMKVDSGRRYTIRPIIVPRSSEYNLDNTIVEVSVNDEISSGYILEIGSLVGDYGSCDFSFTIDKNLISEEVSVKVSVNDDNVIIREVKVFVPQSVTNDYIYTDNSTEDDVIHAVFKDGNGINVPNLGKIWDITYDQGYRDYIFSTIYPLNFTKIKIINYSISKHSFIYISNFSLLGSNDMSTWITLSNYSCPDSQSYDYDVDNKNYYKYYKIRIWGMSNSDKKAIGHVYIWNPSYCFYNDDNSIIPTILSSAGGYKSSSTTSKSFTITRDSTRSDLKILAMVAGQSTLDGVFFPPQDYWIKISESDKISICNEDGTQKNEDKVFVYEFVETDSSRNMDTLTFTVNDFESRQIAVRLFVLNNVRDIISYESQNISYSVDAGMSETSENGQGFYISLSEKSDNDYFLHCLTSDYYSSYYNEAGSIIYKSNSRVLCSSDLTKYNSDKIDVFADFRNDGERKIQTGINYDRSLVSTCIKLKTHGPLNIKKGE